MAINRSDLKFFELLSEMKNKMMISENIEINVESIRTFVKNFSSFAGQPADIPFEETNIIISSEHSIRLRHYFHDKNVRPVIIYFPGNAFIHDLFEENHAIVSKIAKHAGCHAVMIECRLAPENPYPAPLEDDMATLFRTNKLQ